MTGKKIKELLGRQNTNPMLEFISEDTDAQELIEKILYPTRRPYYIERYKNSNYWPTLGVKKVLLDIRNAKIVLLSELWRQSKSILSAINRLSYTEWWGLIENERSIRRIVSKYYIARRPLSNETDVVKDVIIEWFFALQDKIIEKLSLLVNRPRKKHESDFEYGMTLWKLVCLHQHKINSQGRNKSKMKIPLYIAHSNIFSDAKQITIESVEGNIKTQRVNELIKKLDEVLEN